MRAFQGRGTAPALTPALSARAGEGVSSVSGPTTRGMKEFVSESRIIDWKQPTNCHQMASTARLGFGLVAKKGAQRLEIARCRTEIGARVSQTNAKPIPSVSDGLGHRERRADRHHRFAALFDRGH